MGKVLLVSAWSEFGGGIRSQKFLMNMVKLCSRSLSPSLLRVKEHSKEFAVIFFTPLGPALAGGRLGVKGDLCLLQLLGEHTQLSVPKLDESFQMTLSCKALQIPLPHAHLT